MSAPRLHLGEYTATEFARAIAEGEFTLSYLQTLQILT